MVSIFVKTRPIIMLHKQEDFKQAIYSRNEFLKNIPFFLKGIFL